MSEVERLPVDKFRKGLARVLAQPVHQIGKNSLGVRWPVVPFDFVDLKAETTKLSWDMGNILAGGLGYDLTVPADGAKQF